MTAHHRKSRGNNKPQRDRHRHEKVGNYHSGRNDTSSANAAAPLNNANDNSLGDYNNHTPPHKTLLIQLGDDEGGRNSTRWYRYGSEQLLQERNATVASVNAASKDARRRSNSIEWVTRCRVQADSIYRREVQLFQQEQSGSSDERWIESTLAKGTLKDRIAAASVSVATHPIHKLYVLDSLLQMAGCSTGAHQQHRGGNNPNNANSRVTQLASQALVDLFVHSLLPTDRKLVPLDQRPLFLYNSNVEETTTNKKDKKKSSTATTLSPRLLLLWRFEELVREKFHLFLHQSLLTTLRHGAEPQKVDALKSAALLLQSVPEQEALLLEALVNKLGDPQKKIAATARHELHLLLNKHPAMKHVVAREVQQLTHRPRLSAKALYNAIIFLNQLPLESEEDNSSDEEEESDDEDEKKPSLTAKGPYADTTTSLPASLIRTYLGLFERVVATTSGSRTSSHKETAAKKKQAKRDKKKKAKDKNKSHDNSSSKEARALETRLLSALLTGVNRARPYLPERESNLLQDHVDALYRVAHTAQPAAATQALLLLFHVVMTEEDQNNVDSKRPSSTEQARAARQDRFYRALYSTLSESNLVGSGKHLTMFFNLLYKAMKADTNPTRVLAFSKRLFCTTIHGNESVVAASLFLMNEIAKTHPVVLDCFQQVLDGPDATRILNATKREPLYALESANDAAATADEKDAGGDENATVRRASGWELSLCLFHYHPSVSKFASSMGNIEYSGDPLKDFMLAPFLDKFAYRNPKKVEKVEGKFRRGQSVAERRSGTESLMQAHSALPVNDPSFLEKEHVDEQDEFFHKFFAEQARRDKIKGVVRYKSADSKADDDEDQAEIDAFDEADARMDQNFESFEDQWETDSEEEAFVDSLAQKVIEDAIDGPNGPADLDDEDPDMEGWGDVYSDDDDDDDESPVEATDKQQSAVDDDAFMDASSSESEGDSELEGDGNNMLDGKMEGVDSDSDVEQVDEMSDPDREGAHEESDENMAADFLLGSDDSSTSDQDETVHHPETTTQQDAESSAFADAAEYEERINNSWNELKRYRETTMDEEPETLEAEQSHKKKTQRRRGRR